MYGMHGGLDSANANLKEIKWDWLSWLNQTEWRAFSESFSNDKVDWSRIYYEDGDFETTFVSNNIQIKWTGPCMSSKIEQIDTGFILV